MVKAALLALAACAAPPAPPTRAVANAAHVATPAPPAPPPRQLSPAEIVRLLHAYGEVRATALQPPIADGIPAFAPCVRPDAAEQSALLVQHIAPWLARRYPTERMDQLTTVAFGCVEAAGTIVDVANDRIGPGKTMASAGHWLTLRVTGDQIAVLAEVSGMPQAAFQEWMPEVTSSTVALADLDGDGALDPVLVVDRSEGGSPSHDLALSVVSSKTGKTTQLGQMSDRVDAAWWPARVAHGPIVLAIGARNATEPAYRCVGADLALGTCPEAAAAKAHGDALAAAQELVDSTERSLPDRDRLATLLDALGAKPREREAMLADAQPTTPALRVQRQIAAFAKPASDRTTAEIAAARAAEAAAYFATLRNGLGETACPVVSQPRLAGWAKSNIGAKLAFAVEAHCGGYAWITWRVVDTMHHVLVRAEAARVRRVMELTSPASNDPTMAATAPSTAFQLSGMVLVGVVVARDDHKMFAISNGAVVASREGDARIYAAENGERFASIVVEGAGSGAAHLWHVTPAGFVALDSGAVFEQIDAHESRRAARAMLESFDPATDDHAEAATALVLLGADPALVSALRAL